MEDEQGIVGLEEDDFRSAIFESDDIQKELVFVPEWGKKGLTVELWALNGLERASVYRKVKKTEDPAAFYGAILTKAARYPRGHKRAGERIFQEGDDGSINTKNSAVLERLSTIAARISRMTPEAVEEKKENS
jgi:hypothetical protein